MANRAFRNVGVARVGRSVFDLSHQRLFTCDMGELIPSCVMEVVPGDVFNVGAEAVIRFNPLVAPVLHEINAYIHYFFVPYRILWSSWEDFITGGADGTSAPTLPTFDPTDKDVGSLWDYLGFPTDAVVDMGDGLDPVAWPQYAYEQIYNDYYRDENLVTALTLGATEAIQKRAWEKDYFTSALPWLQRGTAPALPISGVIDVDPKDATITMKNTSDATARDMRLEATTGELAAAPAPSGTADARWVAPQLEVDLSGGTTFDIADFRLTYQVQRWLERNARAGYRYTEFLRAHFGAAPRDDRLDRPEYIGGLKMPVIVSEVLQTGETNTTPQGTMAGHGLSVDRRFVAKYRATEFGLIMGIFSVLPRTVYSQGISRNWIKSTKLDYYFPEFANLSEQAVVRGEIYADGTSANNNTVFGYQGRFDELRYQQSGYSGKFRSTLDHWHVGRTFASAPTLNQTFIECVPRKDIFAASSEDGLLVSIGNRVRAVRPLPIIADPALVNV